MTSSRIETSEGPQPSDSKQTGRRLPIRRLLQPEFYLPVTVTGVFLGAWEWMGTVSNPILFAPPSRIAQAAVVLVRDGVPAFGSTRIVTLQALTWTTLNGLLVGFALSIITGLVVGVLFGRQKTLARVAEPYIDAVYATPRVVLTPLIVMWFGLGYNARIFLVWLGATIPIIINTAIGIRNARPDLEEVGQSFGMSERQLLRHVIMPGAVPYVLAGLRIAAGRAMIGIVIGEMFLNLVGLGGFIRFESARLRTANAFVAVMVLGIMGATLISSLGLLESKFASWKKEQRSRAM
jgi:ABC-type nitrate/sulfonate/bicarbonate transport system permease component